MKSDEIRPGKRYDLTEADCIKLYKTIDTLIENTCIDRGYDIEDIKPNTWLYILYIIYNNIFSIHTEIVKSNDLYHYNIDNILKIYDKVYYPLCVQYKQIVSIYSFLRMIGIDYDIFVREYNGNNYDGVTYKKRQLRKKALKDRENTLESAMIACKSNPIKYLAIGNRDFGWNESKLELIPENKPVITLDSIPDLPKIELSDSLQLPDKQEE